MTSYLNLDKALNTGFGYLTVFQSFRETIPTIPIVVSNRKTIDRHHLNNWNRTKNLQSGICLVQRDALGSLPFWEYMLSGMEGNSFFIHLYQTMKSLYLYYSPCPKDRHTNMVTIILILLLLHTFNKSRFQEHIIFPWKLPTLLLIQ